MKVEFYDSEGVRHMIAIDGPVTKEKVGKLLDLVELMSGTPQVSTATLGLSTGKFDRLAGMIVSQLKGKSFSSGDAKKEFEIAFKERIPLSTVSTYLTRLVDRGVLERQQGNLGLEYRVRLEEEGRSLVAGRSLSAS